MLLAERASDGELGAGGSGADEANSYLREVGGRMAGTSSGSERAVCGGTVAVHSQGVSTPHTVPMLLDGAVLGHLGEQWATAWLKLQPWVEPDSVAWKNAASEQGLSHDVECRLSNHFRSAAELPAMWASGDVIYVEVKTKLGHRKAQAHATAAQTAKLLAAGSRHLLMQIDHFTHAVCDSPGADVVPRVRIVLPPPPLPPLDDTALARLATCACVDDDTTAASKLISLIKDRPGYTIDVCVIQRAIANSSAFTLRAHVTHSHRLNMHIHGNMLQTYLWCGVVYNGPALELTRHILRPLSCLN